MGLAFAVRLIVILATPDYAIFGDPADYDRIGRFLVDNGEYPPSIFAAPGSAAALRPPGYPYFLAGLYEVFGQHWDVARFAGVLLGTASIGLIWSIVRRVADERLALWTAGIAALLPSLVWVGAGLTAETLFIPLMLGAVWAAVRHRDAEGSGLWILAAGVLLGLAVLARTNGAIVLLPLLAAAWLPRRKLRDVAVLIVGFAIALTPWTVRNAVVFHSFAPLGTQSGFTMVGNYNSVAAGPGDRHAAWHLPMEVPYLQKTLLQPGTNEAEVDAKLRDSAIDYAFDHPRYVISSSAIHGLQLFHIWRPIEQSSGNSFREMGMPNWTWKPATAAFLVFLVTAVAGFVVLIRRREKVVPWWVWAVPVVIVLSVLPLLGPPRYRIPADPFIAILSATALMALWDRIQQRRHGSRSEA